MATIAVVGAGPGLGRAVARRFGREGFDVALLARSADRLDELVRELAGDDVTADSFAADVTDRDALTDALTRAGQRLGTVEVLVYAPAVDETFLRPVLDTTHDQYAQALDFAVHGPLAAVRAVLDGMRTAGGGTVLAVNGATAISPRTAFAGTSVAFAAERALVDMLHDELADDGIHVAQLIIPGAIAAGHPDKDPDVLADRLWSMHANRSGLRTYATPLDDQD